MSILNFHKSKIEPFAIKTISLSYDTRYSSFTYNASDNNFDYNSKDNTIALEVSTIIPKNIQNVLRYANSLNPKIDKVINAKVDNNGNLKSYYGGSIQELKDLIIDRIKEKEEKGKRKNKVYLEYELCLCVLDGGLFEHIYELNFIKNQTTFYKKIFIITASCFFAFEKGIIKKYNRIYEQRWYINEVRFDSLAPRQ